MPIYEYVCKKCKNCFEYMIFSSDDAGDISCPSCGSKDTEKIMSAFSCKTGGSGGELHAPMSSCGTSGGFS